MTNRSGLGEPWPGGGAFRSQRLTVWPTSMNLTRPSYARPPALESMNGRGGLSGFGEDGTDGAPLHERVAVHPVPRGAHRISAEERARREAALAQAPLFANLPKRHLRSINKLTGVSAYEEGAVVVQEGDQGSSFHVLLDGPGQGRAARTDGRPSLTRRLLRRDRLARPRAPNRYRDRGVVSAMSDPGRRGLHGNPGQPARIGHQGHARDRGAPTPTRASACRVTSERDRRDAVSREGVSAGRPSRCRPDR